MALCPRNTISSNIVGLSVAEEECPRELPAAPVWYDRAVNSYSDFGGEVTTVAADPINASRQNQRGTITDLDASGGYNIDMRNGLTRDMQGFFFADAHEKPDTAPLNGTPITITGVSGAGAYAAASGLTIFTVGSLVLASGFGAAENNGLSRVTAAATASLTTDRVTVAEAAPPAAARVQQVGFQFAAGGLSLTVGAASVTLTSAANAWLNINAQVGEWLFIGGDAVATRYDMGYGYGRVRSKTNGVVVLDNVAWTGGTLATNAGAGKTIRVFAGTFIRNEKNPSLIVTRTYQVERTVGDDEDGVQSEYLVGAVANELTLNLPLTDKHSADFTYMALDNEQRNGNEGVKAGTHVAQDTQAPYNTSAAVFRLQLTILDASTLTPTALFGYASDATFTINNNATATKALGALGGIDINVGNFVVGGSVTAYFSTVESVKAIRRNADCGFNAILAQANKGLVYDIPLMGVGGGRLNVEKDSPITVPIENNGAENPNGYTMSYTSFDYLPTVAMPAV